MDTLQRKGASPRSQSRRSVRPVLFVLAALLFLGSTVVAYLQSPRPNPFQPASFLSLDWWRYPIERNAFKRLPVITSNLNAVFALPGTDKVWAVGTGGMIVHSGDGGRTWTRQTIVVPRGQKEGGGGEGLFGEGPFGGEAAGEGAAGEGAAGEGGYDAEGVGGSQEPQQKPPSPEPAKGARLDVPNLIPHAYAAEQENSPQQTRQYQEPQTPLYQEPTKNIEQPQQSPVQQGQSEPSKQPPAANNPAPNKSPTPEPVLSEPRPEIAHLYDVHFVNEKEGWVVGADGVLLHTADGGTTWMPQVSGTTAWLYSVHFTPDGRQGWVVGSDGAILHTADGGTAWTLQTSGVSGRLFSAHFTPDGRLGWVVGGRTLLHTDNGGTTWALQTSGTYALLNCVHFTPDGRLGWVVGTDGTIIHTLNGGAAWTPQTSDTTAWLESVQFTTDGRQGWIAGGDGVLLYTIDGGTTWTPQTSDTTARLRSVYFTPDGRQGWIVGADGTVLHTLNAGTTWFPQARSKRAEVEETRNYRIWPAPWYYIVGCLLPLALLFVASQQRQDEIPAEEESVADRLVSDRPLEAGDPDPLGFGAIAQGLSRFLRNEKTQPPLTIAITGEWGTGKSSLMNLLKADLERYGFRPVWFNAWHHQQEDQLLAALLENVRHQGVPPWWHPASWGFRMHLLWARGWRHWGLVFFLLMASMFSLGYFVSHPQTAGEALQQVRQWLETLMTWGNGSPSPTGTESTSLLTLLGSLLASLVALKKGLTAFGVDPAVLLTSVSDGARVRDLGAQASFRHKFAVQFRDVTRALHPRTMLILIDDLDRCRPEKVLEVLEAINFLVASGECYVVIGMALERVERCVGLGFKDVAEELMDGKEASEAVTSVLEEGRKTRAAFARQYLEKLINIEVPVPTPTSGQAEQLLTAETPSPRTANAWLWSRTTTRTRLNRYAPWLLLALILTSSSGLGVWFGMPEKTETPPPPVDAGQSALPGPGVGAPPSPPPSSPTPGKEPSSGKAEFFPGQLSRPSMWLPLVPLVFLLVIVAWVAWRTREEVVVKDSPEFVEALKIWLPVITAKQNTPRSVKRFLNRVRYLAMLQRPQEETNTSNNGIFSRVFQTNGTAQANGAAAQEKKAIPESLLVSLSAVQHWYPEWAEKTNSFAAQVEILRASLVNHHLGHNPRLAPKQVQELQVFEDARVAHESHFSNLNKADTYWSTFVEMSEGIRVQS